MKRMMLLVVVSFSLMGQARVASRMIEKEQDPKVEEITNQSVAQVRLVTDEMGMFSNSTEHSSSKSTKVLAHAKKCEEKKSSKIMEECAHCQSLCEPHGIVS